MPNINTESYISVMQQENRFLYSFYIYIYNDRMYIRICIKERRKGLGMKGITIGSCS